jgi:predicted amidohydrolase YtcJ
MRADLVITGANVLTMTTSGATHLGSALYLSASRLGAVAVAGDRILAVDSDDNIQSLVDDRTQILALKGKTVLPGFFDTHVHFFQTGLGLKGPDLSDCRTVEQVLDLVREGLRDLDADRPAFFHRCFLAGLDRPLTRWDLDRLAPRQPVGVGDLELHRCVVNSAALEAIQIVPGTQGVDGIAGAEGRPTGLMADQAHVAARSFFYDAMDERVRREALQLVSQAALQAGVTTVHAIEGREAFGSRDLPTLLEQRDTLPLHLVLYSQSTDLSRATGAGVQGIADLWADGAYIDRSAALLEPYADDPTTCGRLNFTQEEMDKLVFRAHSLGLQVGIHAIGDAAIEQVLWAYERVQKADPSLAGRRPRIEHFSLATEQQIERAAQLGVGVSMQPAMSAGPQRTVAQRLGAARAGRRHPYRKIVDAGLLVAGSSDSDVTPIRPLAGIHTLVNQPEASRRLTVLEALTLFTVNGARLGGEDNLKGTIEPGKLADLVVLGGDPLTVDPGQIGSIPIDMTIVGGRVRWTRT